VHERARAAAIAVVACAALAPRAAVTPAPPPEEVMTYIHHPPESARDVRYVYQWQVLQTALEKTTAQWGPYRMVASEVMTERRLAYELRNSTPNLTVMYLGTTPDFERELLPVRIPVDRNLGGYCIFLIRAGEQARFDAVRGLDDLKKFTYGLGLGWIDVEILTSNGFRVVTGSSYDGLFEMLVHRRFDVFLRAAVEILEEYEQRKPEMHDLRIEDGLILYYPLPMYFWFAKTQQGRRLAERTEAGMRIMLADSSYDEIFDRFQRSKIERLHLKTRTIYRIDNPFLGPETPFADKRLWFDPKTYRARAIEHP
jgi:ABC-type amino acid transport substrate-binding protein